MSLENHVESLKARHAAVEDQIHAEYQRPKPNDQHISELKRQKLSLKEQMEIAMQSLEAPLEAAS